MDVDISLIITTFNGSQYIKKLLLSISVHADICIEIIIIDDFSTDHTLNDAIRIAKKLGLNLKTFLNDKKCGSSIAGRNKGLQYAIGKYIMFADQDDYFPKDAINKLYDKIKEGDYDLVTAGFDRKNAESKVLFSQNSVKGIYPYVPFIHCGVQSKIHCAKIIKKIKFDENIPMGEDILWTLKEAGHVVKAYNLEDICYTWFYNHKSLSNTKQREANLNLKQIIKLIEMLEKHDVRGTLESRYYILTNIVYYIYFFKYQSKMEFYLVFDKIIKQFNESLPKWYLNKYIYFFPRGRNLKMSFFLLLVTICYWLRLKALLWQLIRISQ